MNRIERAIEKTSEIISDLIDKGQLERVGGIKSIKIFLQSSGDVGYLESELMSIINKRSYIHERMEAAAELYGMKNQKLIAKERSRVSREMNLPDVNYKISILEKILYQ